MPPKNTLTSLCQIMYMPQDGYIEVLETARNKRIKTRQKDTLQKFFTIKKKLSLMNP